MVCLLKPSNNSCANSFRPLSCWVRVIIIEPVNKQVPSVRVLFEESVKFNNNKRTKLLSEGEELMYCSRKAENRPESYQPNYWRHEWPILYLQVPGKRTNPYLGSWNSVKRNWKQCLCKILEWPTKSIIVWYGISVVVNCDRYYKFRQHWYIECFHMTSRRQYWCPKTMKRRPCWCPKPILWELNSFLMQTLCFVPINLHRCWPRELARA